MAKNISENLKKTDNSSNKNEKPTNKRLMQLIKNIATVVISLLIITGVIVGFFYFLISKNAYGMADKYRKQIAGMPVLRNALPEPDDPEDPKYLTDEQIKEKYNELRALRDELNKKLDDANLTISVLQAVNDENGRKIAQYEQKIAEYETQRDEITRKIQEYEQNKLKLDELIAMGDKDGFAEYFETINPETAQLLYEKVITERQAKSEAQEYAKVYESMDETAAAKIFESMGTSKIDFVANILKNMSSKKAAKIIEQMSTSYAAKITEKLFEIYESGN